jgi:hypothetical protein
MAPIGAETEERRVGVFLKLGRGSIPELNELGPIESIDTWNLYRKRLMASPFLLAWGFSPDGQARLGRDAMNRRCPTCAH